MRRSQYDGQHRRMGWRQDTNAGGLDVDGDETGWHDEHGVPAPWPEDFYDPDSGWQPTTGGDTTNTNPNQPF